MCILICYQTLTVSTNVVLKEKNKNELTDALLELKSSQSLTVECLNNMTQLMKESLKDEINDTEVYGQRSKFGQKCIYHEADSHNTTECFAFKKLSDRGKFKILKGKAYVSNLYL